MPSFLSLSLFLFLFLFIFFFLLTVLLHTIVNCVLRKTVSGAFAFLHNPNCKYIRDTLLASCVGVGYEVDTEYLHY